MTPATDLVEFVVAATKPYPATKLRRPGPRPAITLGDKVLQLRQLSGTARARAEAQFLKDAEPFIRRCAAWYFGNDLDEDDVIVAAQLAVWSCVLDWDEALGAPFDTWARWKIRTDLGRMLRGSRIVRGFGKHAAVSFEDTVTTSDAAEPSKREVRKALKDPKTRKKLHFQPSPITAQPRPGSVNLTTAEHEPERDAAVEVAQALAVLPPDAAELIRAELRGDAVDKRAAAAARELLGLAVLRRRRSEAA